MVRTAADDEREALVSVEAVAYGLAALDCNIWEDPGAVWRAMEQVERDGYVARARFVLGIAEDTPAVELRTRYRWMPEEEAARRHLTGQVVGPGRAVKMSLHTGLERPAVVQVGDQRAVCTCGRWRFEDIPEPSKHISGCPVIGMQVPPEATAAEVRPADPDEL
jgi:hypothetical protein